VSDPPLGYRASVSVRGAGQKGYGLFAEQHIKQGEIIDVSPAIVFNEEITSMLMTYPETADRLFVWDGLSGAVKTLAAGLGLISMCNHSSVGNAEVIRADHPSPRLLLVAKYSISSGEEIVMRYRYPLQDFGFNK
jgi:hypothetical protein